MERLDYLWRLFGTGLSFSVFGIGGIVLALGVFPLMNACVNDPERRIALAQRTVHRAFRVFVRFMMVMGVIDLVARNVKFLRNDRGALIAANHPSLLDVVLLMSLLDRAQCVVKHQIWNNPFMRGTVTATNYIRNDDDPEKLLADCSRLLAEGNNLIIFPEGSRTVPGQPRNLQRGLVNIAVRSGSPVRLVTITCVPPMLRKNEKWYHIPHRRPLYTVRAHELIDPSDFAGDSPPSVAVRRLSAHIGDRYGELLSDA
jgi:1-acyl-sn-glycerol-3-phosphate acyltransferase